MAPGIAPPSHIVDAMLPHSLERFRTLPRFEVFGRLCDGLDLCQGLKLFRPCRASGREMLKHARCNITHAFPYIYPGPFELKHVDSRSVSRDAHRARRNKRLGRRGNIIIRRRGAGVNVGRRTEEHWSSATQ